MKGSIEMPVWYEEYQERELSIRQAAHRNIRMDQIEDRRARELSRKFVGYTMITCMILLVGAWERSRSLRSRRSDPSGSRSCHRS